MIDKLRIDPEEAEVYDLSVFGLEARILCKTGKFPELWDSENCWKIAGMSEENCSISLLSTESIATKTIRFSYDDFEALKPILQKALQQEIIVIDEIDDEEIEPIFSEEID